MVDLASPLAVRDLLLLPLLHSIQSGRVRSCHVDRLRVIGRLEWFLVVAAAVRPVFLHDRFLFRKGIGEWSESIKSLCAIV